MSHPKVLVGCPTSDHKSYCLQAFVASLKALTYPSFDVILVDNSQNETYTTTMKALGLSIIHVPYTEPVRKRIADSRNVLVEKMLTEKYDYFFSLEQDVLPPPDVIEQLLAHDKKVISGVYFKHMEFTIDGKNRKKTLAMANVSVDKTKDLIKPLTFDDVRENVLMPISSCGLGCVLIHKDVFLKGIRFRAEQGKKPFDDIWFCKDVKEKGFEIYLDTAIKCKHLQEGMNWQNIR